MTTGEDWTPTAGRAVLELRAQLLERSRAFFAERGVLEVETPVLGRATATDPHIDSVSLALGGERLYLQTSPEAAMKRLLAAGVGSIFQIAKVFRAGESGRRHNPEFTLLEWYRPGLDHHALMDEVSELLTAVVGAPPAECASYESLFREHVGLSPHGTRAGELADAYRELGLPDVSGARDLTREDWLNLLMAQAVEPELGFDTPLLVYDYPVELAALARIRSGRPPVAERFEVYYGGMELANGYHELTSAAEQRERFSADSARRRTLGKEEVSSDEPMLAALEAGLPPCAGVALGFDRLVMIAAGAENIRDVLSFAFERA